ncbi:MAG: mercuric reductase [Nitrospirae bacterium GWC2_46_6]|nr:MAG: mercuric reductase [Nitrospirae bacterium GWC2_46_6]OGW22439.1 MAG: mercuric reductase [Nitrospirae bacterium GWA2_46_11]OGW23355.1 MAG: mercuric reductase [Nitrospirae bacterium GWB2_47_37]HAK87786.1 mercuric reductase [Nitrospiraceae bacterium]
MASYDFDIGILGGGAAGLTVAAGAARLGAKVLLIEKDDRLGGDCLHFGCVPSKTLIKTAGVYHLMKNAAKYGLPQGEIGPVDFRDVSGRIKSIIGIIQEHDSVERFCKLGAKVEFGRAFFIDEHSIDLNGKKYSAKYWVIATGSSPSIPKIDGLDKTPYLTNRDIFYLDKLPASIVILGGGPISVEMAQAFNRLGTKVTVVQHGAQILNKEDRDMADAVMKVMTAEGVKFYLNADVLSVKESGTEKEVLIKQNENTVTIRAEAILVAAGRDANIKDLGLDKIDVEFERKGLKVDARLRTNHKHIYGAGDVIGGYQFTHAAGYEGGIVISNAVFHIPRKTDYTFFPWCTYTDPELANIGMNEKNAKAAGIKYSVRTEEFTANDRALAEGEHTGRIKMILNSKERPIGVQILGPRAGDLISEWAAVMNGGVKLTTLASSVHPYPTLGEINKKIAGTFLSEKLFSGKTKKILKLFFGLRGSACRQD